MYDFFIPYGTPLQNIKVIQLCKELGYHTIAWVRVLNLEHEKLESAFTHRMEKIDCDINQLFRLHVITSQSNFSLSKMKGYDILSVEPLSAQTFYTACEQLPIDIITIPNRKTEIRDSFLKVAYQKHIRIEFLYGPTLKNDDAQQQFFINLGYISRTRCNKRLLMSCGTSELKKSIDTQAIFIITGYKKDEYFSATNNLKSHLLKFQTKNVHGGAVEIRKREPSSEIGESKPKKQKV
eukprot:NODE_988_length_2781_cov_0.348248.p2 type:complete len:237 gc:universal NODE_988_length_2781_cov_0.348248:1599-889(-)